MGKRTKINEKGAGICPYLKIKQLQNILEIYWNIIFLVCEKTFVNSVTRLGNLLDFGNFWKSLATINLPKSPTFLGNFCKCVKIFNFSSEIIFGQLLQTFGNFLLVTLFVTNRSCFLTNWSWRLENVILAPWGRRNIENVEGWQCDQMLQ